MTPPTRRTKKIPNTIPVERKKKGSGIPAFYQTDIKDWQMNMETCHQTIENHVQM